MEDKIKITFYYIKNSKNNYTSFKFLGILYKFDKDYEDIFISKDIFNGTNNCLPCQIDLFSKKKKDAYKFVINVYKCENIFYLFLKDLGLTFELIFLNFDDIKIDNQDYKFDNNNNRHRKRVTFINYNKYVITLNEIEFTFCQYFNYFPHTYNDFNSIQFSFYSKDLIIPKINELPEPINIKDFVEKNNEKINIFCKELKDIISDFKEENFIKLLGNYKDIYDDFLKLNFCISKDELKKIFNNIKYYDFYYKILVLKVLINKKKSIKNKKDIESILNSFNKFSQKIREDNNLKFYQKIFAIIEYCFFIKKYDYNDISYVICEKVESNSVIDKSLKFFKDFISNLDEESPVFFKLLEINSKYGYYKGSTVFNFNLLNVENIKQHLFELIPEVIYFFDLDDKKTNTKAFTLSQTGEIAINKFYLFNKYEKVDLTKNNKSTNSMNEDNIAMTISRYFLHEEGGNNKFRNKANLKDGDISPIKCVSEGTIKTLTYLSDRDNSNELIKIFPNDKKGKSDSGHLLETALGKYNGEYIITYLDRIKNIGNLLYYPEYFAKADKIKVLGEYLYYKYLSEKRNIKINRGFFYTLYKKTLEDYIKELKLVLMRKKVRNDIERLRKKNDKELINLLNKKTNRDIEEQTAINKINELNENESSSFYENSNDEEKFSCDEGIIIKEKDKKKPEDNIENLEIKLDEEKKYDSSDSEMLV